MFVDGGHRGSFGEECEVVSYCFPYFLIIPSLDPGYTELLGFCFGSRPAPGLHTHQKTQHQTRTETSNVTTVNTA
jgi:hypothetical protein